MKKLREMQMKENIKKKKRRKIKKINLKLINYFYIIFQIHFTNLTLLHKYQIIQKLIIFLLILIVIDFMIKLNIRKSFFLIYFFFLLLVFYENQT